MLGLGLHFLLELAALASIAVWGFQTQESWWQKALAGVMLPLLAAAVWGIFRVPNDPGPATVAVPGLLRLLIEWSVMGLAVFCLNAAGRPTLALVFAGLVVLDYLIMYERVLRLAAGR